MSEDKARCDAELRIAIERSSEVSDWSLLVWADNYFVMASMAEGPALQRGAEHTSGHLANST